jgi:arginyl-tRNA synthetase
MKEQLRAVLDRVVADLLAESGDRGAAPDFALDPPRQAEHGDFACNAALVLSKRLGRKPREIAERLRGALGDAGGLLERSEIAGPGFLNLWLAPQRWRELLETVLSQGGRFGSSQSGRGQRVQVEFVSANPTGPLTLGHGRQAVLGDSIARLLAATGHAVTREYYFNNGGRQMRVLGASVRARYLEQLRLAAPPPEAALKDPELPWSETIDGLPVVFPRDGYQGAYISELAAKLRAEHGDSLARGDHEELFRKTAETAIFEDIQRTLDALGIRFDVYYNEHTLYEEGKLDEVLGELRAKDLVYESEGATWLRATALGLGRDRVVVKRTGEPTYLLPDIAYHREKFRRGFEQVIDIQGADHIEQFPFVKAAIGALGLPADRIELVMHQFVTLSSGGAQVKQSTRRATYVTVDELLAEVGADVFRFFMVQRRAEGHLDFDLDLAKDTDWKKNPAYYVQYAFARSCGILRKAAEEGVAVPTAAEAVSDPLVLPEEIDLLKKISELPQVVEQAAATREPHHLAYYARELAGLWNPYLQDGVRHRVVSSDAALTRARLALSEAVRIALGNALALLGVSQPERM